LENTLLGNVSYKSTFVSKSYFQAGQKNWTGLYPALPLRQGGENAGATGLHTPDVDVVDLVNVSELDPHSENNLDNGKT